MSSILAYCLTMHYCADDNTRELNDIILYACTMVFIGHSKVKNMKVQNVQNIFFYCHLLKHGVKIAFLQNEITYKTSSVVFVHLGMLLLT